VQVHRVDSAIASATKGMQETEERIKALTPPGLTPEELQMARESLQVHRSSGRPARAAVGRGGRKAKGKVDLQGAPLELVPGAAPLPSTQPAIPPHFTAYTFKLPGMEPFSVRSWGAVAACLVVSLFVGWCSHWVW
jgi:hypothetical protein